MAKQYYKSIYFQDYPSKNSKTKTVTLAFNDPEKDEFANVKNLTNQEIRELIGIESYKQLELFAEKEERSINQFIKRLIKQNSSLKNIQSGFSKTNVTFKSSKNIPFQRWYPYIEGYSQDYVKSLIKKYKIENVLVYDPFAGTGTTVFAADIENLNTVYSEVNPLLQFLINTKIRVLQLKQSERTILSEKLKIISANILDTLHDYEEDNWLKNSYTFLFGTSKYFSNSAISLVLKLRNYIDILKLDNELLADVVIIAVLSSLIPISHLKKVGDVRFKRPEELKKEHKTLREILPQKIIQFAEDILRFDISIKSSPQFILSNAKHIDRINDLKIGAIITSPPYLNGTNYFRNTKLELWFLRYLQYENDLRLFRDQALCSGINDVKTQDKYYNNADIIKKSSVLKKTIIELNKKAYDRRIPIMVKCYFEDMYNVFKGVKRHLINNSKILIDIGDSIFANVHVKTDEILVQLLQELGYKFNEKILLRKRRSKNQEILSQILLSFDYSQKKEVEINRKETFYWKVNWNAFKQNIPHQQKPFSKRNWGHQNHSLCSYQGKLKPSIAHHLIKTFVPENGSVLDPFCGVSTIPFEACLNGKVSYGIDISLPAYYISSAKVSFISSTQSLLYIKQIEEFIKENKCNDAELFEAKNFGFNKTLSEYYEVNTLNEILLARRFIRQKYPKTPSEMLVVASLLHILHGNRPYALSRNSHPIVPYAPRGEFMYKNLIKNLTIKVQKAINQELPLNFKPGKTYLYDSTSIWPQDINSLDAIITSPPFYDSTRFYLVNWIRLWFSGWSSFDFKNRINSFLEEKQKKDFKIYESIFRQARERLKKDGVLVLHLGKSVKCDMAVELQRIGKRWFKTSDLFDESVQHCESHGIRDKGTVTSHQYLVLV